MISPDPDLLLPPGRKILVVGASGSIGHLVVAEAHRRGFVVRALVRRSATAKLFPAGVEVAIGDVTVPATLPAAVADVSAVVFTLRSNGHGKIGTETVDYSGVRTVLKALDGRRVRIALMTSIGVTNHDCSYNRCTEAYDWKRRSERLVRRSGLPYTILRPGRFDDSSTDEQRLMLLQGDRHHSETSGDCKVTRQQIARVLVHCLTSEAATRKTFELISAPGLAPENLDVLLASLHSDTFDGIDAVDDISNMPLENEPFLVRVDLDAVAARAHRI